MKKNYRTKKAVYKGIEMKSNLEARTAMSFDRLGLEWEYEPKTFWSDAYAGGRYTPDFYLPQLDCWVEVAGKWDERHKSNAEAFWREQRPDANDEAFITGDDVPDGDVWPLLVCVNGDGDTSLDGRRFRWGEVLVNRCLACGKVSFLYERGAWECPRCHSWDSDRYISADTNLFGVAGTGYND